MRALRGLIAILLAMLGLWCLFWLPLFVVLSSMGASKTDCLMLAAFGVASFAAAYLIQPWWPSFWRRRREGI